MTKGESYCRCRDERTKLMTMTIPFSEYLSEQWLLERTYHAHLRNGRELSVPSLTGAMKQLIDFSVPLSSQSWKSKLAERGPLSKSTNGSDPAVLVRHLEFLRFLVNEGTIALSFEMMSGADEAARERIREGVNDESAERLRTR